MLDETRSSLSQEIDVMLAKGMNYPAILQVFQERGMNNSKLEDLIIERISLTAATNHLTILEPRKSKTDSHEDMPEFRSRVKLNLWEMLGKSGAALVLFLLALSAFYYFWQAIDFRFLVAALGLLTLSLLRLMK